MSKANAKIKISLRSSRELKSVFNSLMPELHNLPGNRARASAKVYDRTLQLTFEAEDSTALRAIISSFLRITKASLNSCDTLIAVTEQSRRRS
ncbi:MAG TPA: KEOPS complex subunit Pcc1 [Candidatus Bathyarchaeia archaeon]|nr:KEOPS complex subunit Pcc1 [Candidatus Bathyarchaeia archaeon]